MKVECLLFIQCTGLVHFDCSSHINLSSNNTAPVGVEAIWGDKDKERGRYVRAGILKVLSCG